MVYFSELIGKPVYDSRNQKIGVIKDFCFNDGTRYAVVSGIVCKTDGRERMIKWKYVRGVMDRQEKMGASHMCFYLNCEMKRLKFSEPEKPVLTDILDKQIIDISGARIVRVNDILLGKVGNKFAVIGVDTSNKGLLRRLGFPTLTKKFREHVIMWKDVSPLSPEIKNLQIKTKRERINELHPAQIADLIRDLSIEEKAMVFNTLSEDKAAKTLVSAQPEVQRNMFKTISLKRLAALLEAMPPHDAADILNLVPSLNKKLLRLMKPGISAKIKKILRYSEKTAGGVMSTKYVSVPMDYSVRDVLDLIRKEMPLPRHVTNIYVTDRDGVLRGVAYLRDIALAKHGEKVSELMRKDIFTVHPETNINEVFNLMEKYELMSLPVVDKDSRIMGIIRVHDLFDMVLPESIKKQRIGRYKTIKALENHNAENRPA